MHAILLLIALVYCCMALAGAQASHEQFAETLLLQPLADGRVFSHFQFTTSAGPAVAAPDAPGDYYLFPRSMGQLIRKYRVNELRLSLTQGRWLAQRWGMPLIGAPSGAELLTEFDSNVDAEHIDDLWKGMVNTLSGLLCASLQELSQRSTTTHATPPGALLGNGVDSHLSRKLFFDHLKNSNHSHTRRGVMPGETVCTENLTPWGKLLPCQRQQGLARLLNPESLYDVSYHSQGLHIFTDVEGKRKLIQTMSLVSRGPFLEPAVGSKTKKKKRTEKTDFSSSWSLFESMGVPENEEIEYCPFAANSSIYALYPDDFSIRILPDSPKLPLDEYLNFESQRSYSKLAKFDFSKSVENVNFFWENPPQVDKMAESPLTVSRFLSGQGQDKGGLSTFIYNDDNHEILLSYFDALPWQLRVYFHTMKFQLRIHSKKNALDYAHPLKFERQNMVAAEDHGAPNLIEFSVILPPKSSLFFSVEFDKAFMHWTEYPPDAHKGYSVGSAAVVVHSGGAFTGQMRKTHFSFNFDWLIAQSGKLAGRPRHSVMYTDNLTFELPTPDFSMPYNVVCLTGTVFALFFGNLFNVLVRRLGALRQGNKFVSDRPLARFIRKLRSVLPRLKEKLFKSKIKAE